MYCARHERSVRTLYKRGRQKAHVEVWQLGWSIFHHQALLNPYTMITSAAAGCSHLPDADSRRLYVYSRGEGLESGTAGCYGERRISRHFGVDRSASKPPGQLTVSHIHHQSSPAAFILRTTHRDVKKTYSAFF